MRSRHPSRFATRGICYDAGVRYEGSFQSRPHWDENQVRRDFRTIRQELGCNAVLIMADTPGRLEAASRIAAEAGLAIWLQPRLFDRPPRRIREFVSDAAVIAENLRRDGAEVGLVVGCELTLSANGMLPGPTFWTRAMLLPVTAWLLPIANRRLRRLLGELVTVARERFHGPVSYGAGDWEQPDWSIFDVVGLDSYRDEHNSVQYGDNLRRIVEEGRAAGQHVMIFEFGTCAYAGSSLRASQASDVLRGTGQRMRVKAGIERNEEEQARYLAELFDAFALAEVDGTFVWGFSEPALYRSMDNPEKDLDLASYGIVANHPDGSWDTKRAFHTVAAEYGGRAAKGDSR